MAKFSQLKNSNRIDIVFIVFLVASFFFLVYNLEKSSDGLLNTSFNVKQTPTFLTHKEETSSVLVIIAHGFGGSSNFMKSLSNSIATAGHRTVRFDLLGHGINPVAFSGDVSNSEGPSVQFINQLNSVIDFYKIKFSPSHIVLVGHSMATDIIIRTAATRRDITSLIALSAYTNKKLTEKIPNILVLNGEWESNLVKKTKELFISSGIKNPELNKIYNEPKTNYLRKMSSIKNSEHVGILYMPTTQKEIGQWFVELGLSKHPHKINHIGLLLVCTILNLFFLFLFILRFFPQKKTFVLTIHKTKLFAFIIGVLLLPFLQFIIPFNATSFPVFNYLMTFFFIVGILLYFVTPVSFEKTVIDSFNVYSFFFLIFFFIGLFGYFIDNYISTFIGDGGRIYIFCLLLVPCLCFSLSLQKIYQEKNHWLYVNLVKFSIVVSLGISVFLNFDDLFLLSYAILILLLYWIFFGFLSSLFNRRNLYLLSNSCSNGVVLAWTLSTTLPLYSL